MKIKQVEGKTIKNAEIEATESSDDCFYSTLVLEFTDGTSYSMRILAYSKVCGIFFKSDQDDDGEDEVELIKP